VPVGKTGCDQLETEKDASGRGRFHAGGVRVTNSGGSWARRQGLHFRRLCARAGCGAPATATLRFQPTLRQAWLVDLDESAARTQGDLCRRHAAALVLPRGWELHDERTGRPRPVEETAPEPEGVAPPRRVRVRRRAAAGAEPGPDPLPGFEPVVVSNGDRPVAAAADDPAVAGESADPDHVSVAPRSAPAQFGANDGDEAEVADDALNTILDARTPLLQRAFRNAKPEPGPDER
jgi:hypothetical protein